MEGNLRFRIDWASLILGSKLTIFALFYFEFEGYFPSTSPQEAYSLGGGGGLTEGFLRYWFGGLIFGGAYTWRGLFSEFYGNQLTHVDGFCSLKVSIKLQVCNQLVYGVQPLIHEGVS